MDTSKKFRTAKKWLAIVAALLILCTILMWGIASGWGDVIIERVSILGSNGSTMTAIQLVPRGVSVENPAPVVLTNHGANNSGYSELVFGIELARRGYVVFCCDQPSAGEAPINKTDSAVINAESWIDYALSQKYCDGRIVVTGLSRGGTTLASVLNEYGNKIDCAVNIVGAGGVMQLKLPINFNFCSILADADGIDATSYGYVDGHDTRLDKIREVLGKPDYEFGDMLGSFNEGNALQINSVRSIHPLCYLFDTVHSTMYDFVGNAVPTSTSITSDNLIYKTFLLVSWICCFLFVCLAAQLVRVFATSPCFASSMITKLPKAKPISGKKRTINAVVDLAIPIILLPFVFMLVSKMSWIQSIFRCTAANSVIAWLLVIAMFSFIVLMFRTRRMRKERTLKASDFGMGGDDEIQIWNKNRILNGFFIAVITTVIMFTWITAVISLTGINYSAHAFAYFTRITPERLLRGIPYVIIIIPIVLMININVATVRRFPDKSRVIPNTVKEIVLNIFLAITPLILYLLEYLAVGYFRGTGESLLTGSWQMALNNSLGFPFMMGASVGISTYLNRKTGNIWSGVFTASFILGLFTITAPLMAG